MFDGLMVVLAIATGVWLVYRRFSGQKPAVKPTYDEALVARVREENSRHSPNSAGMDVAMHSNTALGDAAGRRDRVKRSERKRLARIEFSYIDAEGEHSHRSVNVFAVNAKRFEGYCHKARGTRTFLIERVQGDLTDLDTGELIAAAKWARALKKSTGGGSFAAVQIQNQKRNRGG